MPPLIESKTSGSQGSSNVAIAADSNNLHRQTNERLSIPLENNTPVSENISDNHATTSDRIQNNIQPSLSNRIDTTISQANHKITSYNSHSNTNSAINSVQFFRSSGTSASFDDDKNNTKYTHYNSYYHSDYDNDRNNGVGTKICGQGVLTKLLGGGTGGHTNTNHRNLQLSASSSDLSVCSHSQHHTMKSSLLRSEYTDSFGTQGYYSSIATANDAQVEDLFAGDVIEKYKDFINTSNISMQKSCAGGTFGSVNHSPNDTIGKSNAPPSTTMVEIVAREKLVAPNIANEIVTATTTNSSGTDKNDNIEKNDDISVNNNSEKSSTVGVVTTKEKSGSDINSNVKSSAAATVGSRRSALSFFLPLPSSSSSTAQVSVIATKEQQQLIPSHLASTSAADASSTKNQNKEKLTSILSSSSLAALKNLGQTNSNTASISPLAGSPSGNNANIYQTIDNPKIIHEADPNLDSKVVGGNMYDFRKLSSSSSSTHQQLPKKVNSASPRNRKVNDKQTATKQKAVSSSSSMSTKGRGGTADKNNSSFNLFHPFRTTSKWSSTLPAVVEESNTFDSEENGVGGAGGTSTKSKNGTSPRPDPVHTNSVENENNSSIDRSRNSQSSNHGTFEILNAMKQLIMKQQEALKDLSESNLRYRQEIDVYHECMKRMEDENTRTMSKVQTLLVEKESYEKEAKRLNDEVQHLRQSTSVTLVAGKTVRNHTASRATGSTDTATITNQHSKVDDSIKKHDVASSTSMALSPSSLLLQFESYVRQSTGACVPIITNTNDGKVNDSVVDSMKQRTTYSDSKSIMINNNDHNANTSNIKSISTTTTGSKHQQQQVASLSSSIRDEGTKPNVNETNGNAKRLTTIKYGNDNNNNDDDSDDTDDDEIVAIVRSSSSSSLSSYENIDQTWSVIDRRLEQQPIPLRNTNNNHDNGSKTLSTISSKANMDTTNKSQGTLSPNEIKINQLEGNDAKIHTLDSSSFPCNDNKQLKNDNDMTPKIKTETKDDDASVVEPSQEVMMIPVPAVVKESRDDAEDMDRCESTSNNNTNSGKGKQIVRKLFRSLSGSNKRNNNSSSSTNNNNNNQATSLTSSSNHNINNNSTVRDGCPENNNKQYDDPYGEIHVSGATYRVTTAPTNDSSVSSSAELNEFQYNNDNKKIVTTGISSSNAPPGTKPTLNNSEVIAKVTVSDILENVSATTTTPTTPTDSAVSLFSRKGTFIVNNHTVNATSASDANANNSNSNNTAPVSTSSTSSVSSIDTAINDEVASFKSRLGTIQKRRLSRQQQKSTTRATNSSPSSFVVNNTHQPNSNSNNNNRSPIVRFVS